MMASIGEPRETIARGARTSMWAHATPRGVALLPSPRPADACPGWEGTLG
jgi:hypothetical protein